MAESFEWIMFVANTEFVPWRETKRFSEQQCYDKKGAKKLSWKRNKKDDQTVRHWSQMKSSAYKTC